MRRSRTHTHATSDPIRSGRQVMCGCHAVQAHSESIFEYLPYYQYHDRKCGSESLRIQSNVYTVGTLFPPRRTCFCFVFTMDGWIRCHGDQDLELRKARAECGRGACGGLPPGSINEGGVLPPDIATFARTRLRFIYWFVYLALTFYYDGTPYWQPAARCS